MNYTTLPKEILLIATIEEMRLGHKYLCNENDDKHEFVNESDDCNDENEAHIYLSKTDAGKLLLVINYHCIKCGFQIEQHYAFPEIPKPTPEEDQNITKY